MAGVPNPAPEALNLKFPASNHYTAHIANKTGNQRLDIHGSRSINRAVTTGHVA